ncbi:hypothetical protein PENARI_c005G10850 [Penicillium arizonense]|uniref:Dyp-type peroxidase n=1 Tax=Penicillium arizonense TaxID=1835702 RepID=A0A1F5LPL1_PENAI|nr:hypothetical protein PENARI_c005G10850 [Penicillium arizonense]OGE54960.1 hypothetical protein PENARI_c005G10850 [Penicillium arizonense]
MSKTTTAYIKDLGVIHDPPRSNALTRLKRHIREVQVKWGPLMAAKEDVFDEYNFPPGRFAMRLTDAEASNLLNFGLILFFELLILFEDVSGIWPRACRSANKRSVPLGQLGARSKDAMTSFESQIPCLGGTGPALSYGVSIIMNSTPSAKSRVSNTAVSTPGDLLFHIRSERRDICFEFEHQLMDRLGDSVQLVDQTVGFRYFDTRDLLGFVDGTANPVGLDVPYFVLVAREDDPHAQGGSYVVKIIGRTKPDNIELDDAEDGKQDSDKTLSTIEDETGDEHDILRDNMPIGPPANGEFGTYFIGCARRLWVIEKMFERMSMGHPSGLHDRLLDFSRPLTGNIFFAPSATVMNRLDG